MRPLSQLVYARIQEGAGSPRIVTLHRHNQFGEDVKDFALAAAPDGRIIGLESFKGVFVGKRIVGYTWYVGPMYQPSPLFYGDGLAEIERFLWDEVDRQADSGVASPALPYLLGVEQGAIMALGTAAVVPDLLSGVIAISGAFPLVPGWEPPLAPLDGLPILLVDPPDPVTERPDVLVGESLADTLRGWGADVTRVVVPDPDEPSSAMATWLRGRTIRHHTAVP